MVKDGAKEVIPKSLQLIAGKTAQEFNRRKDRNGAYWEDRYHATAVETEEHLAKCLVYVDMNMIRAGVVHHPSEWPFSGYNEIQLPPDRYSLIDREGLIAACNLQSDEQLRREHRQWIEEALSYGSQHRQPEWTESIAVGSQTFIEGIKEKLNSRVKGRKVTESTEHYQLREPSMAYNAHFGGEKGHLSIENT
ncbi:MAG: transposase, partial [Bacteroidetes bacterium]|nr:transposase [Bacteroidota bacterium]